MLVVGQEGLIHVGPRVDKGQGKYDNLPPERSAWVVSATNNNAKTAKTVYVIGVDGKNNPVYTDEINSAAKFDRWSDVKKFWRNTTCKMPKDMPQASIRLEEQRFGKGPVVPIRTS